MYHQTPLILDLAMHVALFTKEKSADLTKAISQ